MPGSVHEVRFKKIVVVITDKKKTIGKAGVILSHTFLRIKIQ